MMHRQTESVRRSSYLSALTQQIEKKLQMSLNSPKERIALLQELFRDIALEIDARAQDILLDQKQDDIAIEDSAIKSSPCFYEVLAEHFLQNPENSKPVLHLIVQLWSQSFASQIFSLLFYKWLFESQPESTEGLLRYASAFVEGASNVFWIDIQSNTKLFYPLFHYIFEEVSLVPIRLNKIPVQARQDLLVLVSRFFFFYEPAERLEKFLSNFPPSSDTSITNNCIDFFVAELTYQLQKLKVEPVLVHYLTSMRVLQGREVGMTTNIRLRLCLYSLTTPGGPLYPTRAVRHATRQTMDCLFPAGRYSRHLISLSFRMLHPSDFTSSCWSFLKACIHAVLFTLWRLFLKIYEKLFGCSRAVKRK